MKNLRHEAHKVRLTPEEKAAMRARIFGAPSGVQTSAASPYFFFSFQFSRTFVPVLAVLVVLFGTGTAYAAEGSLPGDPLYVLKLNVTEPLRAALAAGTEARAEVHIALAARRVEEAEALAAQGRLSATTTQELEENFDEHVSRADALALEVGHTDPAAATEIQARTNSSLSVHGAILASLGEGSSDHDSQKNSGRLAARVLARVAVAASAASPDAAPKTTTMTAPHDTARVTALTAPAPGQEASSSTSGAVDVDAIRGESNRQEQDNLKKRAESALAEARDRYGSDKDTLGTSTQAQVEIRLTEVQALIDAHSYGEALGLALNLQVILQAQKKYRDDITTPLLKLHLDLGDHKED